MATTPAAPVEALAAVHGAEVGCSTWSPGFDDGFVAGPSLLPGWTVGQLVTHLARNADSHTRRTAAAIDGVMVDQYPGGMTQRTAEIDGARRSARALLADLTDVSGRLLDAWAVVPDYAWANTRTGRDGNDASTNCRPAGGSRSRSTSWTWGSGITFRDWSDEFVESRLPEMRAGAGARLQPGDVLPAPGGLDPRDELAWLYGRLVRDGPPVLGPWS